MRILAFVQFESCEEQFGGILSGCVSGMAVVRSGFRQQAGSGRGLQDAFFSYLF